MHVGELLIFLSLVVSIALFVLICVSVFFKKDYIRISEIFFYVSGLIITLSVILLFAAFLGNRFDLSYVYNYSSRDLQLCYKLAGFWAGQEGTFLLWTFFLFIFGFIILIKRDDYTDIVLSVIVLTQIFILFILSKHSPFEYIWQSHGDIKANEIPVDGSGLNPLLQDPWMIIHPPVLFLGYASACIPYGYAIAALIRRGYTDWIFKADKWILFCMVSMGAGIFLGAYWAYTVLGWGGYWGWDPVENSSLIPWFAMIALMHGIILQKKKNALIKTNIFLAGIGLVLVFYGTFLTRSGILSDFSVHSFSDLGLKSYLIVYIVFFLAAAACLLIKRFRHIKTTPLSGNVLTIDNCITYGIVLLLFYTVLILIGTSMPILSNIFLPNAGAVNERFYNTISIPLGILILSALIISEIYRSPQKQDAKLTLLIASASVVCGLLLNIFYTSNASAYIFSFLGFFIVIQNVFKLAGSKSVSAAAPRLAHLGIGVLIIGIVTSNIHSYSIQKNLIKNIEAEVDSIKLTFKGINNNKIQSLKFMYYNNNSTKEIETPYYFSKKINSLVKEPFIDYGFFIDIYISPVEYKKNLENFGKVLFSKGEEKIIDGIKIKFVGYEIDKAHIHAENARLYVKLNANINGKDYTVKPGLIIGNGNNGKIIEAVIPHFNRKVSLLDFDIEKKKIFLYIEPAKNAVVLPDSVIVEVSFKRLVWLVWLGTVLISIGGIMAVKKALR